MPWNEEAQPNPARPIAVQITRREQGIVRQFLQDRAPHLVEAYDSAHALLNGLPLPSAQQVIAHLLRDLLNSIPAATLRGTKWEPDLHNPPNWSELWFRLYEIVVPDNTEPTPIAELTEGAKRHIDFALVSVAVQRNKPRATELIVRSNLVSGEIPEQVKGAIKALENHRLFFVKHAHLRESEENHRRLATIEELRLRLHSVENILASFLGGSVLSHEALTRWLKTQDPLQLSEILERAAIPALATQFWNGLSNPALIVPLHALKRFTPSVQIQEEEGTILLLSPSLYALARLTPGNPEEGTKVWQSLKLESPHDLHQLIEAATKTQTLTTGKLAAILLAAIDKGFRPLIEREVFELIKHLVAEGGAATAVSLTRTMLQLQLDDSRGYKQIELKNCDVHDLRSESARQAVRNLLRIRPRETLKILLDSIRSNEVLGGSWHGLTSIDSDSDNYQNEAEIVLIETFRDAIRAGIEEEILTPSDAIGCVSPTRQYIERRLHIYLVNMYGDQPSADLLMGERNLLDDGQLKNEAANLFRRRFAQASPEVRSQVLQWIKDGKTGEQETPKNEEHALSRDSWRMNRLSWIRDQLPAEELRLLATLQEKFGQDSLIFADRDHHGAFRWGSISPHTAVELASLSIDDAVLRVTAWTPSGQGGFNSPTIEGLADVFGQAVARNAATWSSSAIRIAEMKPYFVSRALNGWLTHAKANADLDWRGLLDLIDVILLRPSQDSIWVDLERAERPSSLDHDAKWMRGTIADLIEEAFKQGASIELRPRFLMALTTMIDDDPASSITQEKDFFELDHPSNALNSNRGKVASALCAMLSWTAKTDPLWREQGANFTGDLSILDDVHSLIERHLNDRTNQQGSTWAAYGFNANQLRWLDPTWYQTHIADKLVLAQAQEGSLAPWAFWATFLRFQHAHRIWLAVHSESYKGTAHWLQTISHARQSSIKFISDYLKQLMVLYWRGEINLEIEGVLATAFANTNAQNRMQAILFVGKSMDRKEEPPQETRDRLTTLWEWYWTKYGIQDVTTRRPDPHRNSLFGEWFSSNYFDPTWSITTFLSYLTADAEAVHSGNEFQQLVEQCGNFPTQSLDAGRQLVLGDRQGWRMYHWSEHVQGLWQATSHHQEPAIQRARSLFREAMVRRGHGGLIGEAPPSPDVPPPPT